MQSRKHSLIESVSNTALGFVVSVCLWEFVVKPVWDIHTNLMENLSITLLFTVVSIIRGYVFRRFFNSLTHKKNKKEQHDATDWDYRACP